MVAFGAVTLLGGILLAYNIYKMTVIDADLRGIKHPKLWGFLNTSGNNGNAFILLYLLARRNYPVKYLSDEKKCELARYKKQALVALAFHLLGGLAFAICLIYYLN